MTTTEEAIVYKVCRRCGKRWLPRKPGQPRVCPNPQCHSTYWDTDRGSPIAPIRVDEAQR